MKRIAYVLSFLLLIVFGCKSYSEVTFVEANDPQLLTEEETAEWKALGDNVFEGAWVSTDYKYSKTRVPKIEEIEVNMLKAWRGERVSAQVLLWTTSDLEGINTKVTDFVSNDMTVSSEIAQTRFVRYTLSDDSQPECKCRRTEDQPVILAADMLDSLTYLALEANTVRPIWLTIEVPEDIKAGLYRAELQVYKKNSQKLSLPLELEVVDRVLPSYDKWGYHLDLWQHPAAVARIRNVELWSEAHFAALKEEMEPLAKAGQKVITCTLNKDPWNHQCYDAYDDMIKWTFKADGSWDYDYTVFDKWVDLMLSLGINKMINCYSMLPWGYNLHYFDENTNSTQDVMADPMTPEFEKMWGPFLKDFSAHLVQKGWLQITNIAMDERSPETMQVAADLLTKYAPDLGFAFADNHRSYKNFSMMKDVCVGIKQNMTFEEIRERRENGDNSTFYVCCSTHFPNTFTFSQPYESELLIWFGVAMDYDGMLRWAYNSWPENPEVDSRFSNFASGDTYFPYPYGRSSLRFERMIDGIEAAEKIRILRADPSLDLTELDKALQPFLDNDILDGSLPWQEYLSKAIEVLNNY